MYRSARSGAPVPALLRPTERGAAGAPATGAAIPLAAIAALAREEAPLAAAAEQLQQGLLMRIRATAHVRSADGRKVDDNAKAWQKSEQRSVASATDRRARVSRPGPSPLSGPRPTPTRDPPAPRIPGSRVSVTDLDDQPDPDPRGRLQTRDCGVRARQTHPETTPRSAECRPSLHSFLQILYSTRTILCPDIMMMVSGYLLHVAAILFNASPTCVDCKHGSSLARVQICSGTLSAGPLAPSASSPCATQSRPK